MVARAAAPPVGVVVAERTERLAVDGRLRTAVEAEFQLLAVGVSHQLPGAGGSSSGASRPRSS